MPDSRETQPYVLKDMMGPRHLSLIQEESGSRESTGVFPPLSGAPQRSPAAERPRGREGRRREIREQEDEEGEGVGREEEEEEEEVSVKEEEESERGGDPATLALYEEHRRLEDSRCLLEELTLIEADLRQSDLLDVGRQRERAFLRETDNRMRWQSLLHLSLSQRVTRPWVTSYFRKYPMHIYCLPIQDVPRRRIKNPTSRR
ncbi:cilia- and flagella-associated protein 251-like [Gadus morhua]|uniref:cilia- and flagella-associated protein 251-like n=1 Tax=Gadus morhua TaxID=8049 RepID=UPI0011B40B60|nr:cilia- and flagella-associated protein 251-like [Gadus morhua]